MPPIKTFWQRNWFADIRPCEVQPRYIALDGFFSQFWRMNVVRDEILTPHIIIDPSYAWQVGTGGVISVWELPIIWLDDLETKSMFFLTSEPLGETGVNYRFQSGLVGFGVPNIGPTDYTIFQSIGEFTPTQVVTQVFELIEDPFGDGKFLTINMIPVDPCEAVENGFPPL